MKFGSNLKRLLELKNMRVSQLADVSNIDPKAIYAIIARDSENSKYAPEIAKALGISVESLYTGEFRDVKPYSPVTQLENLPPGYIELTYYDVQSSAGHGRYAPEYLPILTKLQVLEEWAVQNFGSAVQDKIRVITNTGDSMSPTIAEGDVLFVDITHRYFDGDGIYIIDWHGKLLTKRLRALIDGRLAIISDNSSIYEPEYVSERDIEQLTICGRVKKWWSFKG